MNWSVEGSKVRFTVVGAERCVCFEKSLAKGYGRMGGCRVDGSSRRTV